MGTNLASSPISPKPRQAIDTSPLLELLQRIRARYRPLQIWLFGSRARGDAHQGSDWDLLVVLPDDAPDSALNPSAAWGVQRGSGVEADVIPVRLSDFRECRDTVNTLSYVAVREGIRLDER